VERHGVARARVWYPAGPGGSNRAAEGAGSAEAAHAPGREAIDDALDDIDRGGLGGRRDAENADQCPCRAAVRTHDRFAVERVVPLAHAQGDLGVTFAARRHETPLVALARGERLRRACANLAEREAFPLAEADFTQPGIDAIIIRREAERRAHDFR